MFSEPDVTLTDYALALLCLWFVSRLLKLKEGQPVFKFLWVLFFGSLALASITGGTVHGFFLDETSLGYQILWPATLLAIGVTTSSAWVISGFLISGARHFRKWMIFSILVFFLYAGVVIGYSQSFSVVIFNYLPPMVVLLILCGREFQKTRSQGHQQIAIGILIGFLAAFLQMKRVAIHPHFFNHNSTYHLVQAFGLWFLFQGAKSLSSQEKKTP